MRSSLRLLVGLGALIVVVVAGLAALAHLKFTSFLSESTKERLEIVAATSSQDFGAAIDLGLALSEVANGEAILERARGHDPDIATITVFDPEGAVLHSVGDAPRQSIDATTLEAFRLASTGVTDSDWGTEADGFIGSGTVIEGSFGQPVGGVIVAYPTDEMQRQRAAMLRELAVDGGIVVVAMVALLGAFFGLFRRRLSALESGPDSVREA